MAAKRISANPLTPFMLWSDLAMKSTEMMLASAQVIGHRTDRMLKGGASPNARDQKEFARMGQEKVAAGMESALAMSMQVWKTNQQMNLRLFQQAMSAGSAIFSLAGSRTLGQALERQVRVSKAVAQAAQGASQMSNATARLTHRGLRPIHSRAVANARRLSGSR